MHKHANAKLVYVYNKFVIVPIHLQEHIVIMLLNLDMVWIIQQILITILDMIELNNKMIVNQIVINKVYVFNHNVIVNNHMQVNIVNFKYNILIMLNKMLLFKH